MNSVTKIFILFLLGAASSAAWSQGKVCRRANGTTYYTTLPCPAPGLIVYGPTAVTPNVAYYPKLRHAGEELRYMSPACSSLSEGIRTAPARGVKYDVVAQNQRDFDNKCREDQAQAFDKLRAERGEKRQEELNAARGAAKVAAQSKQEEDRRFTQCAEMRNAISNRKSKANMTDGEKNDLAVFEQRYQSRCV
jgi:hypothetical protein